MTPVKKKATNSPAPAPSSGEEEISDAEEEMKQESPTRAPKLQLTHVCKERLDELTKSLDFKSLRSTLDFLLLTPEKAKLVIELTRDLGYDNGGQTINWLIDNVRTNQLVHNHWNGGQSASTELPIDIRCSQGNEETNMAAGLPFMRNQTLETGVQNNNHQNLLNDARPLAGINEIHPHEEDENLDEKKQEINKFLNIETNTQIEKTQDGDGFGNIETETEKKKQKGDEFGNIETETEKKQEVNVFGNIEIETETEKKQEVNKFGNTETEIQTEKKQDVINVMEGQKDGGWNEGSPGTAAATRIQ